MERIAEAATAPNPHDPHPRVTIGIPTFNRADMVGRAVKSALEQTYPSIEVIVSDNASTDKTSDIVATLAREDNRLRYTRHKENLGPIGNFWSLVDAARGGYFMWLADDDWLEPGYVEKCVAVLESVATATLVAGDAAYYAGDELRGVERVTPLLHRTPTHRILAYYATVSLNGVFYGVARTETLRRLARREALASDWAHVADIASLGTVHRVPALNHRSSAGASSGLSGRPSQFAVPIARLTFRQVLDAPGLAQMKRGRRAVVALTASVLIGVRMAPERRPSMWIARLKAAIRRHVPEPWYVWLRDKYRKLRHSLLTGKESVVAGERRSRG